MMLYSRSARLPWACAGLLPGLFLGLAFLLAPPALATEDRTWEWALSAGLDPGVGGGRVLLSPQRALPEINLGYELYYGTARAAIGTALRYRLSSRWRVGADFSFLSLPLNRVRPANDGSRTLLEASLDARARWGGLASTTITLGNVGNNDGLAGNLYRALLVNAGSPTGAAEREEVLRDAIRTAADVPLDEEVNISQVRQGDLVEIKLFFNTYFDIISSYPYALFAGMGAGLIWSRLDDPGVRSTHSVVSRETLSDLGDRRYRINISQVNARLPDLQETRMATALYFGARQHFSEKLAVSTRGEYYFIESSDKRADTGRQTDFSVRVSLDFLF